MKKKICLFVMVALMAFLMILPASASCDDCMNHTDSFDWSNHCEANCTCSWGPCPYCGESGAYVEDFCNSVHSYEWSQTSDTSHTGICACGDSVEEECDMVVVSNVEATCDDEGYCVYECSTCGAEYREVLYAPGHEWEETTCDDPTCTVPGIQRYECSVCGESQAETIDALGHSYTATVIAPSCTTGGWTTHICSRCSDTYTDNETAATGHSWTETEREAPTCLSTGKQHYVCSACGETQTDTIDALGHDFSVQQIIDPTCTSTGHTRMNCFRCDAYEIVEGSETAMIAHTWRETNRDDPTCTATGIQRYECSVCGETKAEAIDALGHSYTATVIAPSCTTGGWTTHTCSRCSNTYTDSETAATGHSWAETTRENPTCIVIGKQHYECSSCGETQTDTIDALGHDFSVQQIIDPTCTSTGHTRMNCFRCDAYEIVEGSETAMIAHTWRETDRDDSTCTATGIQRYECSVCGETKAETIAALGHDLSVQQIIDPTCTSAGHTRMNCSRCDAYEIVEGSETAMVAHTWRETNRDDPTCTVPGIQRYECSVCGETKADTITVLGHDFSVQQVIAPTCTSTGHTRMKCSRCDVYEIAEGSETGALGHTWSKTVKEAECEAPGYEYMVCTSCGFEDMTNIPALGHKWGNEPTSNTATCFSVGVAVYECQVCGEEESRSATAIAHKFNVGKCVMCGLSENAVTTKPVETSKPVETTRPIGGAVIPGDLMGDHLSGNGIDNIVDARALLGVFMIGGIFIVVCYLIKKKR